MFKITRVTLIPIILLFCLFLIGCVQEDAASEESKTKIQLAVGEWAPYVSQDLKYDGVVPRIVKESFEYVNVEVEYVYHTWEESMEMAKKGEAHGTFPWLKNEEREKHFYYSDPVAYEHVLFFHKKDLDFNWETMDDLKGYKIGGTEEYFYGEEFDEAEKSNKILVERVSEDKINFEKLKEGTIDLVICEINVGFEILDDLFTPEEADEIIFNSKTISANPLHLLLSKNIKENEELIELFNNGLKKLNEEHKAALYWKQSREGIYKIKG